MRAAQTTYPSVASVILFFPFLSAHLPLLEANTATPQALSFTSKRKPMLKSRAPLAYFDYSAYMTSSSPTTPYASLPTRSTPELESSAEEIHTRAAQELDSVLAGQGFHYYSETFEQTRRSAEIAEAIAWLSTHSKGYASSPSLFCSRWLTPFPLLRT